MWKQAGEKTYLGNSQYENRQTAAAAEVAAPLTKTAPGHMCFCPRHGATSGTLTVGEAVYTSLRLKSSQGLGKHGSAGCTVLLTADMVKKGNPWHSLSTDQSGLTPEAVGH